MPVSEYILTQSCMILPWRCPLIWLQIARIVGFLGLEFSRVSQGFALRTQRLRRASSCKYLPNQHGAVVEALSWTDKGTTPNFVVFEGGGKEGLCVCMFIGRTDTIHILYIFRNVYVPRWSLHSNSKPPQCTIQVPQSFRHLKLAPKTILKRAKLITAPIL